MTIHNDTSSRPIFVIGSPRSGTTLLRLLLTSHPKITIPPECGFIIWLLPTFGCWGSAEFSQRARLTQFAHEVAASRKFETWNLSTQLIEQDLCIKPPASYADACSRVYEIFSRTIGKDAFIWGDKNNFYLSHIEPLRQLFPEARFIHIVRDGRDVACSYRQVMSEQSNSPYRPRLPTGILDIANRWSTDLRLIQTQLDEVSDINKMNVRYEDLTRNPTKELSIICRWLKIKFTPEMLDFHHKNKVDQIEPPITMDWKRRTLAPVDDTSTERYRTQLSKAEEREFLSIASAELLRYRYIET